MVSVSINKNYDGWFDVDTPHPLHSSGDFKMQRKLLAAATASILLLGATAANASHLSNFGSIDAIDFVFGSGGGVYNGTLATGPDDSWMVFGANAGDMINISISTMAFKNAVLLQDTNNGIFSVGDGLNLTNFNVPHVGQGGPDLSVLSHIGDLEFHDTANSGSLLGYLAPFTGQYGIAIGAANNDIQFAGNFTVTLSGNTGSVTSVSEPGTLAILGLGLAGLGFARRKKAVA